MKNFEIFIDKTIETGEISEEELIRNKSFGRKIQAIGLLFFGFLFYIAWHYYKERMLSYDSANYCMSIINTKTYFAGGRWGAGFAQLLPLMALRKHCSLEFFLRLYSVSFILIYYIIFLSCTILLKNRKAGLILMLSMCFGFRWMFYYTVCELYMGMAFSILFYAVIAPERSYSNNLKRWTAVVASLLIIYVISYLHQLALMIVLFLLFYELIGKKRMRDLQLWVLILSTLIWCFIRIHYLSLEEYQSGKILSIGTYLSLALHLFEYDSWKYFKNYFEDSLWLLYFTGALCLFIFAIRKRWLLFVYLIVFVAGYISLIVLSHYKGESSLVYEHNYPPIGLFASVVLVNLIYHSLPKKLMLLIVSLILFINLNGIYEAHYFQTRRVDYIQRITNYGHKLEKRKLLLDDMNIPKAITSVAWALPYESLLLSSIPSADSTITVSYYYERNQFDSLIGNENAFIGPPWSPSDFTIDKLNGEYFHFPKGGYVKINSLQTDTLFKERDFNSKNVFISFLKDEIRTKKRVHLMVPIKIINHSGKKIFSTSNSQHSVNLSYHIYDENGKLIRWENQKTNLEVDVQDEYSEILFMEAPNRRKTYFIEVDMQTEGVRWWHSTGRIKMIVN